MSSLKRKISAGIERLYMLLSIRYILLWTILLCVPVYIQETNDSLVSCLIVYGKEFVSYLGVSVIISCAAGLVGLRSRKLSQILYAIVTIIVFLFTMIDTFLVVQFNLRLYYETIKLFLDTNSSEASEFVGQYIFSATTFGLLFAYLLLYFLITRVHVNINIKEKLVTFIVCPFLMLSAVYGANNFIKYYLFCENYAPASVFQGTFYNIMLGVRSIRANSNDIHKCLEANKGIHGVSLEPKVRNVVLIIGESYIKAHSSLYGYGLNTNEWLSKYPGKISLFTDVITSVNFTSEAIRNLFLVSNSNDAINDYSVPMLPAIAKKAGVNVVFYSNQFIVEKFQSVFDALGSFYMNDSTTCRLMYSSRNTQRYAYDEDLVDNYIANRNKLETGKSNLIIFHLLGQHENRADRFPASFVHFTADSIKKDLLPMLKKKVADYDNATRYNDYVVSKIFDLYRDRDALVVYLSDHGEECYDFRNKNGRATDFDANNGLCGRYQLSVPFMVYASDSCRIKHPELMEQIQHAVDRPYMTDDLPHFIMNLLGVNSSYYKPERDLISDQYDSKRKRIVIRNGRYYNYDERRYE